MICRNANIEGGFDSCLKYLLQAVLRVKTDDNCDEMSDNRKRKRRSVDLKDRRRTFPPSNRENKPGNNFLLFSIQGQFTCNHP